VFLSGCSVVCICSASVFLWGSSLTCIDVLVCGHVREFFTLFLFHLFGRILYPVCGGCETRKSEV
jgi:hypothetical protein